MARGWESKSVESQMDDGRQARRPQTPSGEVERDRQRHGLEMSRRRIVSELETTKSSVRRASLQAALEHLDAELAKLP